MNERLAPAANGIVSANVAPLRTPAPVKDLEVAHLRRGQLIGVSPKQCNAPRRIVLAALVGDIVKEEVDDPMRSRTSDTRQKVDGRSVNVNTISKEYESGFTTFTGDRESPDCADGSPENC